MDHLIDMGWDLIRTSLAMRPAGDGGDVLGSFPFSCRHFGRLVQHGAEAP